MSFLRRPRPDPSRAVLTARRVVLTLLPAVLLLTLAGSAVWGQDGLLARHRLRGQLERSASELAAVDRANQRLLRQLHLMDQDPVVLERMVADELLLAREGTTLYRFEESP